MHTSFKFTALSLGLLFAANALAATDLTVVSFGGANKAAQVKAFYAPWEAKGDGKIIAAESQSYQVDTPRPMWRSNGRTCGSLPSPTASSALRRKLAFPPRRSKRYASPASTAARASRSTPT